MPTSPLQLLTSLGFPGIADMIRAGRIGRKGAIDQVWHAYKVRDVEREGAVAASDAIRAYFVKKDARVKAAVPRGTRTNPTTGSKRIAAAFGKAVLSSVKSLVKGAAVTLDSATGSLWGRGGWDAVYGATVTVEPTQGAPFRVTVNARTAAATRELPAQTAGTVMVGGTIGASQSRPDADVLAWAKKIVSEARPVIQAHAGTYRGNPATTKPKKPRKVKPRTAYQAQAYHFDAASWDRPRVIRWLNRYGHSSADVKLVGDEYVAPQFESWDYEAKTLHRVQVAKHVEAMVGVPLAGSDGANAVGYNKRFGQIGLFPKGKRAPKKAGLVVDGFGWTSDDSPF